jgi:hypothetical protein
MLLAVVAMAACGGQVSGNPDGGTSGDARASSGSGSGSGASSGGSSGGPVPLCPPDPPTVDTSCASPGQGCAYMVGGQCQGYRCRSSGGWETDPTVTCP